MNDYIYQTPIQKRSKAKDFRLMARESLKNKWGIAICAWLIMFVLGGSLLSTIVSNFDNMEYDFTFLQNFDGKIPLSLLKSLHTTVIISFAATLAGALQSIFVGGASSVGNAKFHLELIDGTAPLKLNALFYGFRTCYWKAAGVRALVFLIQEAICLLVLIPTALYVIFGFGFFNGFTVNVPVLLFGPIALLVCGLAAAFLIILVSCRLALCEYILAEYPTLGVLDVLRNSGSLMKGNKRRLFCLELSFIGWILLSVICTCGICMVVVGPYMQTSFAQFYNEVSGRAMAKEVEFPSINPEDYYPN